MQATVAFWQQIVFKGVPLGPGAAADSRNDTSRLAPNLDNELEAAFCDDEDNEQAGHEFDGWPSPELLSAAAPISNRPVISLPTHSTVSSISAVLTQLGTSDVHTSTLKPPSSISANPAALRTVTTPSGISLVFPVQTTAPQRQSLSKAPLLASTPVISTDGSELSDLSDDEQPDSSPAEMTHLVLNVESLDIGQTSPVVDLQVEEPPMVARGAKRGRGKAQRAPTRSSQRKH